MNGYGGYGYERKSYKGKIFLFLLLIFLLGAGYAYFRGILNFSPPEFVFDEEPKYIGTKSKITFKVKDDKPGLKEVKVYVIQYDKDITLLEDKDIKKGIKEKEYQIEIPSRRLGLKEGKAKLVFVAKDSSFLSNEKTIEKQVEVDLSPPALSILSSPGSIINGGAGFVFYRVSPDVVKTGIMVGNLSFKCFNGIFTDNRIYGCAFPYPYYWKRKKAIVVYAEDKAGNRVTNSINYYFKRVKYRRPIINIDDNFIESKVRPLSDKDIKDPAQLFRYVNVEIRKRDEEQIHNITKNVSIVEPLFKGAFQQLKNSSMLGGFADYRKYRYKGRIIKGADAYHKGMDFASIKNAPVHAANNGVVVFTGFLGIYGNSVIIEHGMGIFTLYSHLSEIYVKEGDKVDKKTVIARTDTTGLAKGDHLHFGVLIQGLEVHPIEWLDPKWISTRFARPYKRIQINYR